MFNFFGKPRVITDVIRHRKVSWLELFYDLIFAVVIERITDSVIEDFSISTIVNSVVIFGWFFWSWHETSGYFDNHGNDSAYNILMINLQMIFTGIAAIFIPHAMLGDFQSLIFALLPVQILLTMNWLVIGHVDANHGPASKEYAHVFIGSFLVLLLSLMVNAPFKELLLVAALLVNLSAILFVNSKLKQEYQAIKMNYELKDSLLERYGLMTMIALGEMIAGLYGMVEKVEPLVLFEFAMGIVFAAMIGAVYYQVIGELHVQMKSPIQVMMIRWLFLLEIYLIIVDSILLQVVFAENKVSVKLALVAILFLTLFVMRIIQILTSKQIPDGTVGTLFYVFEIGSLLLTTMLPAFLMIGTINLILLIITIRYHFKITQKTDAN